MKLRTSSNLIFFKYLLIFIFFILVLILAYQYPFKDLESAMVIMIFMAITAILTWLFRFEKIVEFDDNNLYVTNTAGETKRIPLENVYKLKMTMTSVNNANFWKLGYTLPGGETENIRFVPVMFSGEFAEFKQKLKQKSPKVEIQNWSHSFDFDQ